MTIKTKGKNSAAIIGDAVGKAMVPLLEAKNVLADDPEAARLMCRMMQGVIDAAIFSLDDIIEKREKETA